MPADPRRPELQPWFPTAAHQFVWRNWDLVPASRIAQALGASVATVVELGRQMHLSQTESPATLDQRMHFGVLRRNWFFAPQTQIAHLIGLTTKQVDEMLDHDAFYRGHLGPPLEVAPIRAPGDLKKIQTLSHFRTEPQTGPQEARFQLESVPSEPLKAGAPE